MIPSVMPSGDGGMVGSPWGSRPWRQELGACGVRGGHCGTSGWALLGRWQFIPGVFRLPVLAAPFPVQCSDLSCPRPHLTVLPPHSATWEDHLLSSSLGCSHGKTTWEHKRDSAKGFWIPETALMGPIHPELHLLSQVGPTPPEWLVLRTHGFLQKRRNQVCLPLAQLSPTIVPSLWETRHPTRELGVWTVDSLASVSSSSPGLCKYRRCRDSPTWRGLGCTARDMVSPGANSGCPSVACH